jgi:hypothetical protein
VLLARQDDGYHATGNDGGEGNGRTADQGAQQPRSITIAFAMAPHS